MSHTFIGREEDRATLLAAIDTYDVVSLVGSFGVGKTRLSLEIASHFNDTLFIDCSTALDRESVLRATVEALQISADNFEQIACAIDHREIELVIIDNAEQILEPINEFVSALVEFANVRCLVTSREALGRADEQVVSLKPLDPASALELFVERARRVDNSFEVSPTIAVELQTLLSQLDRLPLVIELAAARIETMPPRELLKDLSHRFDAIKTAGLSDRQASVEGAIEWSWRLLEKPTRDALTASSLFRGAFTMDDFDAIVGETNELSHLVEKSFINVVVAPDDALERSFVLLASVRRFAASRLETRDTVSKRFGAHYRDIAHQLLQRLDVETPETVMRDIAFHHTNLLEAFENAPSGTIGLVLSRHLSERGNHAMRENILRRVADDDPEFVRTSCDLANLYLRTGKLTTSLEVIDAIAVNTKEDGVRRDFARLRVALAEGDRSTVQKLAVGIVVADDLPEIVSLTLTAIAPFSDDPYALFHRALATAKRLPDVVPGVKIRNSMASFALSHAQFERAESNYRAAIETLGDRRDARLRAALEANLGLVSHYRGNLHDAAAAYQNARATFDRSGLIRESAIVAGNLGAVLIDIDKLDAAEELLSDSAFVLQQCDPDALVRVEATLATLYHARGDLKHALDRYEADDRTDFVPPYRVLALLSEVVKNKKQIDEAFATYRNGDSPIWDAAMGRLASLYGYPLETVDESQLPKFIQHALQTRQPAWLFSRLFYSDSATVELRVHRAGLWFEWGGEHVEFGRRGPAKKLFLFLAEQHGTDKKFDLDQLFEAGWPEQTIDVESAHKRVYAAIGTLRRLGLEDVILTTDDGYQIDPDLTVTWIA